MGIAFCKIFWFKKARLTPAKASKKWSDFLNVLETQRNVMLSVLQVKLFTVDFAFKKNEFVKEPAGFYLLEHLTTLNQVFLALAICASPVHILPPIPSGQHLRTSRWACPTATLSATIPFSNPARAVRETLQQWLWMLTGIDLIIYLGVSENSVPLNPMVLLIIIPIKWLFHWEYTQHFQTNPSGQMRPSRSKRLLHTQGLAVTQTQVSPTWSSDCFLEPTCWALSNATRHATWEMQVCVYTFWGVGEVMVRCKYKP